MAKTFTCTFRGRTSGAIGIVHRITAQVHLDKVKTGEIPLGRIREELYKDFECISNLHADGHDCEITSETLEYCNGKMKS